MYLTAAPTDEAVILTWNENVPWTNSEYVVYKQNLSGIFDSLTTVNGKQFTDTNLINGNQYCYKIKSIGAYSAGGFVNPIINFSQEVCSTPYDNVPPCAPQLTVTPDCIRKENMLSWHFESALCPTDIKQFNIYYAENTTADPQLIAVVSASDTMYLHDSLFSIAGCYEITATDSVGNESDLSQKICVDNCPVYVLPNVFTPNGDGINDTFHPFPYSFVKDIDIVIYDRWGLKMFSTTNPDVDWNGTVNNTGGQCPDGVYFYHCIVYEIYLDGIKPRLLKGFVHLMRNK